jgi:hypothetical protein
MTLCKLYLSILVKIYLEIKMSVSEALIQQTFTHVHYLPGTVIGNRDTVLNETVP